MAVHPSQAKGKIGVLIEAGFDETEFRRFNEFFPAHGYELEYITHLWGHDKLTFKGNDLTQEVAVWLFCAAPRRSPAAKSPARTAS